MAELQPGPAREPFLALTCETSARGFEAAHPNGLYVASQIQRPTGGRFLTLGSLSLTFEEMS